MKKSLLSLLPIALLSVPMAAQEVILRDGSSVAFSRIEIVGDSVVITGPDGAQQEVSPADVDSVTFGSTPTESEPPDTFTNEDLEPFDNGDTGSGVSADTGRRSRGRGETASNPDDYERWAEKYRTLQERVDAAQAEVDELESGAAEVSGSVTEAGDGTQISGARPGRGYYLKLERAKKKLERAQKAVDELRTRADEAGVPPGYLR